MQFELTINLDNEAFTVENSDELPRILAELAERLRFGHQNMEVGWNYHVSDINGNGVGNFRVCLHHTFDLVEAE